MVCTAKLYMLVPISSWVKNKQDEITTRLLVDMKANSSILMWLEIAGMSQNKQKMPYFHCDLSFSLRYLCYFTAFLGKTSQNVPLFKNSGCCPEILNHTLIRQPLLGPY